MTFFCIFIILLSSKLRVIDIIFNPEFNQFLTIFRDDILGQKLQNGCQLYKMGANSEKKWINFPDLPTGVGPGQNLGNFGPDLAPIL